MINNNRKKNFLRLANKRMKKLTDQFRKIKNLSNKYNYEYDNDDVEIILISIRDEIKNLKTRFEC